MRCYGRLLISIIWLLSITPHVLLAHISNHFTKGAIVVAIPHEYNADGIAHPGAMTIRVDDDFNTPEPDADVPVSGALYNKVIKQVHPATIWTVAPCPMPEQLLWCANLSDHLRRCRSQTLAKHLYKLALAPSLVGERHKRCGH